MVSTQTQRKMHMVKARESLDFSGQNLRGQNFKGQDLAGADFSGADIRGARFTNANLVRARFVGAKAGVQRHWLIIQLSLIFLLVALLNFIPVMLNMMNLEIFFYESDSFNPSFWHKSGGFITIAMQLFPIYSLLKYGLNLKALNGILMVIAIAMAITVATAGAISSLATGAIGISGIISATVTAAAAIDCTLTGAIVFLGAIIGTLYGMNAGTAARALTLSGHANLLAIALTLLVVMTHWSLGLYVMFRLNRGSKKFVMARNLSLSFSGLGATSFTGANITGSNFSQARLKSANFNRSRQRETLLKHTCWDNAQQLNKARLSQSILSDTRVQKLLSNRTIYKQNNKSTEHTKIDLTKADLHEADLNGICFQSANLARADLTHATCRDTDLTHADLTELQAIGTDFTNADLTGACIENWNIDETTILDGVKCDYIFLKQHPDPKTGSRERRPHDPNKIFQPGDFEKLYKQVLTTVELLFRNGIHPASFAQAFQKLTEQYPDATLNKLERKGADILVTLEVPKDADKGQIEHSFDETYNARLEAAREQGRLEGRNEVLEQGNQTLQKLLAQAIEAKPAITVNQNQNQGESIITGDNNTQLNQTNSGGTNFQTNAEGSSLNQAETINPGED